MKIRFIVGWYNSSTQVWWWCARKSRPLEPKRLMILCISEIFKKSSQLRKIYYIKFTFFFFMVLFDIFSNFFPSQCLISFFVIFLNFAISQNSKKETENEHWVRKKRVTKKLAKSPESHQSAVVSFLLGSQWSQLCYAGPVIVKIIRDVDPITLVCSAINRLNIIVIRQIHSRNLWKKITSCEASFSWAAGERSIQVFLESSHDTKIQKLTSPHTSINWIEMFSLNLHTLPRSPVCLYTAMWIHALVIECPMM